MLQLDQALPDFAGKLAACRLQQMLSQLCGAYASQLVWSVDRVAFVGYVTVFAFVSGMQK